MQSFCCDFMWCDMPALGYDCRLNSSEETRNVIYSRHKVMVVDGETVVVDVAMP